MDDDLDKSKRLMTDRPNILAPVIISEDLVAGNNLVYQGGTDTVDADMNNFVVSWQNSVSSNATYAYIQTSSRWTDRLMGKESSSSIAIIDVVAIHLVYRYIF